MVFGAAAGVVLVFGIGLPGGEPRASAPRVVNLPDISGAARVTPDMSIAGFERDHARKQAHHHQAAAKPTPDVVIHAPVTPGGPVTVTPQAPATPKTPAAAAGAPVQGNDDPVISVTPTPVAAPAPRPVAIDTGGIVRLSVRSFGIAPSPAGDPELQVKLGIGGAQASDALPDSVTLHLRPQVPANLSQDDPSLALQARVDMVDAQRTTPDDPSLRLRVRMTIAAVPPSTPAVQEPAGGDGKSNVIALTVGLAAFRAPGDQGPGDDPTTPTEPTDPSGPGTGGGDQPVDSTPGDTGPGGGPDAPGDGGPGDQPVSNNPQPPVGSDPAPAPSEPAPQPDPPVTTDPLPPEQPAPSEPAPAPSDPAPAPPVATDPPADPTPPSSPAPSDPAPSPAPSAPAVPPVEIIIPVGPTRPNSGTTTVPVTPSVPDGSAPADIPIDVTVEQLPPSDPPPTNPADVPTAGVQEPAPEVAPPPAQPDPSPAPDATAPDAAAPADQPVVVALDAPPDPGSNGSTS